MTQQGDMEQSVCASVTCLTMNPAIDMTVFLDKLSVGDVNRASGSHIIAGGKGVNVAAVLAAGGFKTAATGVLGNANSALFKSFFAERGIKDCFLYTEGATRCNIKLVSSAETTDINEGGLAVSPLLQEKLRNILAKAESDFLVLSGSLPPHCPDAFYADFLQFYAEKTGGAQSKAKCVVDCSGKALQALLKGKARPFCIKPNKDELAEWLGKPLTGLDAVLREARSLQQTGIALVVISMGSAGALFVSSQAAYHAGLALDTVKSTVGAGDAMVAGIIAACLQHKINDAVISSEQCKIIARNATLWAAGKLECAGANLPSPARLTELMQRLYCERAG